MRKILYNCYAADIPMGDRFSSVFAYLDDAAALSVSWKLDRSVENLRNITNQCIDWPDKWKSKINLGKSQLINFCKKPIPTNDNIAINNTLIPWKNTVKYLGVKFDSSLTWGPLILDEI